MSSGPLLEKANLDGFITAFDTTRRVQVEAELTKEPVANATRKAEALGSGFGLLPRQD